MLVLSRKKNESIVIDLGNGIVVNVVVVEIRGDKVRLGIDAPKEIAVNRAEVAARLSIEPQKALDDKARDDYRAGRCLTTDALIQRMKH